MLQARAAHAAGARLFQIALRLSETTGVAVPLGTVAATHSRAHSAVRGAIEAEGWHLNHAGDVFRALGSVSRDKLFSSGQGEAISGEIIGIYVFRRESSSR